MGQIDELWRYDGRRVVVTGCASGIGADVARQLTELGAEVIGLDIRPAAAKVSEFISLDLSDPASIDAAAASIGGHVDALFNIAGVSSGIGDPLRVVTINFLGTRRWFAAKGGEIERVEVAAQGEFDHNGLLTLLRVHVDEGEGPQLYFLPLAAAWEEGADEDGVWALMPHALAKLRRRARMGLLLDAMADESFCRHVVEAMGKNRDFGLGEGRVHFSATEVFGELAGEEPLSELGVRRAEVEQTNSSVILGERLILKAYRRLQKGTNPDLEIGRYLTEGVRFENTPPLAGAV